MENVICKSCIEFEWASNFEVKLKLFCSQCCLNEKAFYFPLETIWLSLSYGT